MNSSEKIDQLIAGLDDWRAKTLAAVRKSFLAADKDVVEEWKWMGSPVWECGGMLAVGNAHKEKVKVTFMHGARLSDPSKLFNNGFGGGKWRAIDFAEGDKVDQAALKKLVRAAIDYNRSKSKKAPAKKSPVKKTSVKKATKRKTAQPRKMK
jgi:hypothetical protein